MKRLTLHEICQLERLIVEALDKYFIKDEYESDYEKIQKKLNLLKKNCDYD